MKNENVPKTTSTVVGEKLIAIELLQISSDGTVEDVFTALETNVDSLMSKFHSQ